MFIISIIHQIVWFNFVHGNHTSLHLNIIEIGLHQRIISCAFTIQLTRNIIGETAKGFVIFTESASKMELSIDLMSQKTIEPKNDILAQKRKIFWLQKEADFNMAWNAQDWNEFD